jgi:hypothetical protein
MSVEVTLRWAGAADATIDTEYDIEVNSVESGIGVGAWTAVDTQAATSPYAPVSTTLAGGISNSATTVVLASGTGLSEGDYIVVGGEMILLGVKATATFTGCTRAIGNTLPVAHSLGAVVLKAHESYVVPAQAFPSERYALRYRITRVESTGRSVPAEIIVVNAPLPPFNNMITVWGVAEDLQGGPAAGGVSAAISVPGAYGQDTGEHVAKVVATATLDGDGFWHLFLRRDVVRQGGAFTITFSPTNGDPLVWTVATLPDRDNVNWLET